MVSLKKILHINVGVTAVIFIFIFDTVYSSSTQFPRRSVRRIVRQQNQSLYSEIVTSPKSKPIELPRYDNRNRNRFDEIASSNNALNPWATPKAMCSKKIRILNGVAMFRKKGSIVKYVCAQGFSLLGPTLAVCLNNRWSEPPPICVKPGCNSIRQPVNGGTRFAIDGAVVAFFCHNGYELEGNFVLYCDGSRWNGTQPSCNAINEPTTTPLSMDWDNAEESEFSHSETWGTTINLEQWDENPFPKLSSLSSFSSTFSTTSSYIDRAIASSSSGQEVKFPDMTITTQIPLIEMTSSQNLHAWDSRTTTISEISSLATSLASTITIPTPTEPTTTMNPTKSTTTFSPTSSSFILPTTIINFIPRFNTTIIPIKSTTTIPLTRFTTMSSTPKMTTKIQYFPIVILTNRTTSQPRTRNPTTTKKPFIWTKRPRPRITKRTTTTTLKSIILTEATKQTTFTDNPIIISAEIETIPTPFPDHTFDKFDEELSYPYEPNPDSEFIKPIEPISPHKLNNIASQQNHYDNLAHASIIGSIVLVVIGSASLLGGIIMYCWRKNKGIARPGPYDIDGRTLSSSDAMEDFMWMESSARDSRL